MKKNLVRRIVCMVLSLALLLPMLQWSAVAVEPDSPARDLMSFSSQFEDLLDTCYGLEGPEPEASLAGTEDGEFQTARLVVKSAEEIDTLNAVAAISGYDDLHILQFADAEDARTAYAAYADMESVEYVQADVLYAVDGAPSERTGAEASLASADHNSWGYGQRYLEIDTYNNKLSVSNLPQIVVAVTDTGVMADHEYLLGRILSGGYDFINNDADPDDDHGHGTHVSGTVVDGALENVKILPIKVLDENGSGSSVQIMLGIRYAISKGVDVINMSLSGKGMNYLEREAIDDAVATGITVVAAAGNDDTDAANRSPACFDNVITVAAADMAYPGVCRAGFSNYGDVVDITAPGVGICSSIPYDPEDEDSSRYDWWDGTSMAAPHISAAAAMLLSAHPAYTPGQVKLKLTQAATVEVEQYGDYDDRTGETSPDEIDVPNMLYMPNLIDGTVIDGTKQLSISRTQAFCCPGQSFQLDAAASPDAAIRWSSSNTSIATVDTSGKVTCKKNGVTTIKATANGITKICALTVQSLVITPEKDHTLHVCGSVRFIPETNCDPAPALTWSTNAPGIVSLYPYTDENDQPATDMMTTNGMIVEGLQAGSATVTASFNGTAASWTVTVIPMGDWYNPDQIVYHISTADQLMDLGQALYSGSIDDGLEGKTVYLDNDISLAGRVWTPMPFSGIFDGQGHTVSGLAMTDMEGNYDGMFESIEETAVIRNLKVEGTVTTSETMDREYMGGIAAHNSGTIQNCEFSGVVTAENRRYVGGIAGYNAGVIIDCVNNASITGKKDVGGIAGYNEDAISGCTNRGTVYGTEEAGGIAGYSDGVNGAIRACINSEKVSGEEKTGGIIGYSTAGITDCSNSAEIRGNKYTGGICGALYIRTASGCTNSGAVYGITYTGGICGKNEQSSVVSCTNSGDVMGDSSYTGGISGRCSYYGGYGFLLKDCTNLGLILGAEYTGGICGSSAYNTYNCVNQGMVQGTDYVGGISGEASEEICNCINNESIFGWDSVGGICGSLVYGTMANCVNMPDGIVTVLAGGTKGSFAGAKRYSTVKNSYCPTDQEFFGETTGSTGSAQDGNAKYTVENEIYTLSTAVTAGRYTGSDLLEALNHFVLEEYVVGDIYVYDEYWDEWYLEKEMRPFCFWENQSGTLRRAAGAVVKTADDRETYQLAATFAADSEELWETRAVAARYQNGKITAVSAQEFDGDEYLMELDLSSGSGDHIRVFTLNPDGSPRTAAKDLTPLV